MLSALHRENILKTVSPKHPLLYFMYDKISSVDHLWSSSRPPSHSSALPCHPVGTGSGDSERHFGHVSRAGRSPLSPSSRAAILKPVWFPLCSRGDQLFVCCPQRHAGFRGHEGTREMMESNGRAARTPGPAALPGTATEQSRKTPEGWLSNQSSEANTTVRLTRLPTSRFTVMKLVTMGLYTFSSSSIIISFTY